MDRLVEKLQTVIGINVTPFDESLQIDYEALGRNLDFLVQHNIHVVVPCGNTGEFHSLTPNECRKVISFACDRLKGKATLIAGIGYDVETAVQLALHAQKQGCEAVMIHHPSHPFLNDRSYYNYVRKIAENVEIGIIPYVRSANISNDTLLELLRMSNVVGVKYAVNDLQQFGQLVANTPPGAEGVWICGTAEAWAPFFYTAGATGFTSGLVNVVPELSLRMLKGLQTGDYLTVRQVWKILKPLEDLRARNQSENNVSVVKEAMEQLGLGSRRVRPPISELTQEDKDKVRQILAQWRSN